MGGDLSVFSAGLGTGCEFTAVFALLNPGDSSADRPSVDADSTKRSSQLSRASSDSEAFAQGKGRATLQGADVLPPVHGADWRAERRRRPAPSGPPRAERSPGPLSVHVLLRSMGAFPAMRQELFFADVMLYAPLLVPFCSTEGGQNGSVGDALHVGKRISVVGPFLRAAFAEDDALLRRVRKTECNPQSAWGGTAVCASCWERGMSAVHRS